MTINKIFLVILSVLIYLYITIWTFNHIDAWVAMGIFILGIYIAAKQIFKNNKNKFALSTNDPDEFNKLFNEIK